MILKTIILIIIAIIIQINTEYWFSVLILSAFIGLNFKSYKKTILSSIMVGLIPWLLIFSIKYKEGQVLLLRVSNLFGLEHPIYLIIISLLFITILSSIIALSFNYIKEIMYDEK